VSHRIRNEKICLNCGTETTGHYCPSCGQKNIEPKQSVWHLIEHAFSDITHWDNKFFITVKDLFAKPGFLSKEYMIGRRMRYLDPVRMYIFTSAIFFLIFFDMFNVKNMNFGSEGRSKFGKDRVLAEMLSEAKNKSDSAEILKRYQLSVVPYVKNYGDSAQKPGGVNVNLEKSDYTSVAAYDSVQKFLPPAQREGWLKRQISRKKIELTLRYEKEGNNLMRELVNNNLHNLPKVLFISLPFFALLLKLLYIRRKEFYYVDHGIFSMHLYIFSFLVLLVFFGINELKNNTGWGWLGWIIFLIVIYPFFYYYKAMRRFYGQRRAKTVLKYILLFISSFFVYLTVFLAGIIFTVFES
jgi:Protein of unknown function (DUF3667)